MRYLLALAFVLTAGPAFAQATSQMSLTKSTLFLDRLAYTMVQVAITVKAEALSTTCHLKRTSYADDVIASPGEKARIASVVVVGGVNLIGTVLPNGDGNKVDSSASDAAILSQVTTFWNSLSRCDTGS